MLGKEEFAKCFAKDLPNYIKNYDVTVELREIPKGSEVYTAFCVRFRDEPAAPVVYLEKAYSSYIESGSYEETLKLWSDFCVEAFESQKNKKGVDLNSLFVDNWQERVRARAVPVNSKVLENVTPIKIIGDVAFIPCFKVREDELGCGVVNVPDEIFNIEDLPYTKEELHQFLINKDLFLSDVIFASMTDIVIERYNVPPEDAAIMRENERQAPLYVLTCKDSVLGSGLLLHEKLLKQIADFSERLHDGFYIMPALITEAYITPADCAEPSILQQCQLECSANVPAEEILTDSVYYYSPSVGLTRCSGIFDSLDIGR